MARSLASAITLLVCLAAGIANAAVKYTFTPTHTEPVEGLPFALTITFENEATVVSGDKFSQGFDGLLDFHYWAGVGVGINTLSYLQDNCPTVTPSLPCDLIHLQYSLTPEAGFMVFNNTGYDFRFDYSNGHLFGHFNTDFPGFEECRTSNRCKYEGEWVRVPEPSAIAAFALGFAAISVTTLLGQRRKRS